MVAGVGLAAVTIALGWGRPAGRDAAAFGAVNALDAMAWLAFVLVGSLLVLRRPRHPIGWLFVVLGIAELTHQAALEYVLRSLAVPGGLWGWPVAAWVVSWSFAPGLTAFVVGLLVFPTGRPPSPRWQPVLWVVGVAGVLLTAGWALAGLPPRATEPLALSPGSAWAPVLGPLAATLVAGLAVAAGSLIWRFRRARGDERQQLKWLALVAVGIMLAAAVGLLLETLGSGSSLVEAGGSVVITAFPVAVALAILRYRLYEIDRIISRTASYGLLIALLAGVYAVIVVTAGAALEPFTPDSSIAVALSTLTVAVLFAPLRDRSHALVARWFHRSRYDAEATVAGFQARMRDAVRLDLLASDLLTTVERTVQPVSASVWLRPPPPRAATRRT